MLEMVDAHIHFAHPQYAHSDLTVTRAPTPSHSFPLVPPLIVIPNTQNHIQFTPACTTKAFKSRRENEGTEMMRMRVEETLLFPLVIHEPGEKR